MINSNFNYEDTRWQDLYMFLKNKGYEVYAPASKIGDCKRPYLVVKYNGLVPYQDFSSSIDNYSVMCYVPRDEYSKLDGFIRDVKASLKELEPLFKWRKIQTPSFYDESVQAHMVSIEYANYKKDS